MNLLITGGCGFIGHHIVEHFIKNTDWNIKILDKLTYASNGYDRLRDIECFDNKRIKFFTTDLCNVMNNTTDLLRKEIGDIDYILHLGAETHVDNSIKNPEPFVYANFVGTFRLLEYAKTLKNLKKMIYFSTDEVFGPAEPGVFFKEFDRYNSTNPYSATKAGGEELCIAWANTYKMPIVITHCMNVFGERQHPEKFIPLCIRKIIGEETINIHSDETLKIPGSRFWLHARNVAVVMEFLLKHGINRDKYNIVGDVEVNNLLLAQTIAKIIGIPLKYTMEDFHASRPGHDLRYALDGSKLQDMGFAYPRNFHHSLTKTVEWYLENPKWL